MQFRGKDLGMRVDSSIDRGYRRRGSMSTVGCRVLAGLILGLSLAQGTAGSSNALDAPACGDQPSTTTVVAEAGYQAGGFHRFLFGDDYRDVWATPIEVEVLDLTCEAGGLEPVKQVGQLQTPGLAMIGADGRTYTFRGVNKDPTRVLPEGLRDSKVAELVWDQISANFPGASVAAAPIVTAAGVLQAEPRLVVMPDDPRLGEFRETFAGLLGTFEEFPSVGSLGTSEIISSEEIFERITATFEDRIDDRAFLQARLMDLLIGDWDRHVGQWRWARTPENRSWQPLAEDRDYAFSRYDGLGMRLFRDREPRFDVFGPEFAPLEGLTWSARSLDRRLLSGLDRADWREVALELQNTLTDEVIEAAIRRRTPPEYLDLKGQDLIGSLQARRDALVDEAEKFYEFLAAQVNVYGSNEAELIVVDRSQSDAVEITIFQAAPGDGASCSLDRAVSSPVLRRRFLAGETRDIRLYTGAGDDRVLVQGAPPSAIALHVIGGSGGNLLCDEASDETVAFDLSTADEPGRGERVGKGLWISPSEPLEKNGIPEYGAQGAALKARRDWGHTSYGEPWLGFGEDLGVFVGYGRIFERFSFRKRPYGTQHRIRGGFSFGRNRPRFDYRGYFRTENRRRYWRVRAEASGFDLLNYYGFGNETEALDDSDFYDVQNGRAWAEALVVFPLGQQTKIGMGAVARYTRTDTDRDDFISIDQPYGVGSLGQAGLRGRLVFNSRRRPSERELKFTDDALRWGPSTAGPGFTTDIDAQYYPEAVDLESYYALLRMVATSDFKLSAAGTFLGLRVGGQKNWGTFPFYDAAFIGAKQVRGLPANRFAGDASLYGDVSLRQRIGRVRILAPGTWGMTLRADTGRVFLSGEDTGRWHTSFGTGLWWAPWNEETKIELYAAKSEEETRVYLLMGYTY